MKKLAVISGLFVLAALIALPVASSGNYSASNSVVEQILGTRVADGSPRPPFPPPPAAFDGSPRPPFPPATTVAFDGSPRSPFPPPPVAAFDGSPRPPFPPAPMNG
jgi:hypothetical protein